MFLCYDADTGRELAVKQVQFDPDSPETSKVNSFFQALWGGHFFNIVLWTFALCLYVCSGGECSGMWDSAPEKSFPWAHCSVLWLLAGHTWKNAFHLYGIHAWGKCMVIYRLERTCSWALTVFPRVFAVYKHQKGQLSKLNNSIFFLLKYNLLQKHINVYITIFLCVITMLLISQTVNMRNTLTVLGSSHVGHDWKYILWFSKWEVNNCPDRVSEFIQWRICNQPVCATYFLCIYSCKQNTFFERNFDMFQKGC